FLCSALLHYLLHISFSNSTYKKKGWAAKEITDFTTRHYNDTLSSSLHEFTFFVTFSNKKKVEFLFQYQSKSSPSRQLDSWPEVSNLSIPKEMSCSND